MVRIARMLAGKGDLLPVSAFPVDGTWPTGTTRWEKRNIAEEIPVWETDLCIQCNKCAIVCPHAAIRPKIYQPELLANAPATFKSTDFKMREFAGMKYSLQVAAEDCTGCTLCVQVCPARDKSQPRHKAIDRLRSNVRYRERIVEAQVGMEETMEVPVGPVHLASNEIGASASLAAKACQSLRDQGAAPWSLKLDRNRSSVVTVTVKSLAVICGMDVKPGMAWTYSKRTAAIVNELLQTIPQPKNLPRLEQN